jgi:hypothetical protein
MPVVLGGCAHGVTSTANFAALGASYSTRNSRSLSNPEIEEIENEKKESSLSRILYGEKGGGHSSSHMSLIIQEHLSEMYTRV